MLGNLQIEAKSINRFLGIISDGKFKFVDHIRFIADKVSKSIGILYKLQSYLTFSCFSMIYPYLNYCIIALGGGLLYPFISACDTSKKNCSHYNKE